MKKTVYLGVNIDHVATLRQTRKTYYPDILEAAKIVERSGARNITLHLREDRRHIQKEDVYRIKNHCSLPMNFEMSLNKEIMTIALDLCPEEVCIVPEKRQELTTEGGLDISSCEKTLSDFVEKAHAKNIKVSIFVDACEDSIILSKKVGADIVELHTGVFAETQNESRNTIFKGIQKAAKYADSLGLIVNAGHGLHYTNISKILEITQLNTLNIGHAIICRSIFVGLEKAIAEILNLLHS